ncbi:MAG: signal peptidase II [Oscillospiraceae bacterium]|nr:signal peptidase II [Oscillospiraceae bacterium]
MLCFAFAALIVLLDQFFKRWIVRVLDVSEQMDLIPGVIGLTHIHNHGAAFGIFPGNRWFLAVVAFIICIALVFILLRYTEGFWGTLGLSAVLGGAVGNLLDRILLGYVVDMFQTLFVRFAIFNIADIFITLGVVTFLVHFILVSIKQAKDDKLALENARVDLDYDTYDEQYEEQYDEQYDEQYEQQHEYDDSHDEGVPDFDEFPDPQAGAPDINPEPDFDDIQEYVAPTQDLQYHGEPEPISAPKADTPNSWQEYYEPEKSENSTGTLDALNALELELDAVDDYDVDAMLREYGFEDENAPRE